MSQDYYLCDGVTWNYDLSDRNENREREYRLELARYARKLKLIATRTKSPSSLRKKVLLIFLSDSLKRMAMRYCKLEKLPCDYAVVALQANSLKNCIESHLSDLDLSYKHSELVDLVNSIYSNKERINVYSRVTKIQSFVHCLAELKYGIYGERELDKDLMRKLLSICRLHIHITELRNADLTKIKEEIILNHSMSTASDIYFPSYLINSGKKQIKNWRKRHLHSLLYYATQEERRFLRKLLNETGDLSVNEIIKDMIHEWPKYEPILKA